MKEKTETPLFVNPCGAEFSSDRTHRFALWRIWNAAIPLVMVIGLNPSTANEITNDPTIRRVARFCNGWEYGGFVMMNLFTQVTPYPKELALHTEYDLLIADDWLFKVKDKVKDIIFAWGAFDTFGRAEKVIGYFPKALCLGKNSDGSPKHPLFLPSHTKPISYR